MKLAIRVHREAFSHFLQTGTVKTESSVAANCFFDKPTFLYFRVKISQGCKKASKNKGEIEKFIKGGFYMYLVLNLDGKST